jgi:squalene-hopene/tetraprenyl-beta-curcumene cyclase
MTMLESALKRKLAALPAVDPTHVALADADREVNLLAVDRVVRETAADLESRQNDAGDWCFELEADATIPAEYIMLEHFTGEVDDKTNAKLAAYLRSTQAEHGGWPLFHGGEFNVSASVKAYFALKLCGDSPEAPHMRRAREAILRAGGAARSNVFTRIGLALFEQVPWRAAPVMPVEIMLLPRWAPFHLSKVSYWSRTVIVPLLVLMALKPRAANPRNLDIRELFTVPPEDERGYLTNPTGSPWGTLFLAIDKALRICEPLFPKNARQKSIQLAVDWIGERLNGEDGLGAIFPAMANAVMAYCALGQAPDHPQRAIAMRSIRKLLAVEEKSGYCQPCLSPIWDTVLAMQALMEAGTDGDSDRLRQAADWLVERQILDVAGDWAVKRPGLRPGGWAFQYRNDHYPDVDDTAVAGVALLRSGLADSDPKVKNAIDRAIEWVVGMQSKNGGWGSFDADNTHYYLNHIPFADHGALLDPPTVDVSARCLSFLAQAGLGRDHPAVARGLDYLRREQEDDGSWYGRWGTNYIYGTWSALCAFNACGEDHASPHIRKAVEWLKSRQRADGGWGEGGETYWKERRDFCAASTPSQTSWALIGLMSVGEAESEEVRRGIAYLMRAPRDGAKWQEAWYTAVGFPRIFYLRYHGYSAYFPVWALARYRNLMRGNSREVTWGM